MAETPFGSGRSSRFSNRPEGTRHKNLCTLLFALKRHLVIAKGSGINFIRLQKPPLLPRLMQFRIRPAEEFSQPRTFSEICLKLGDNFRSIFVHFLLLFLGWFPRLCSRFFRHTSNLSHLFSSNVRHMRACMTTLGLRCGLRGLLGISETQGSRFLRVQAENQRPLFELPCPRTVDCER